MSQSRQQAFQQLRAPCVELSSVALKFKANQTSPKAVLLALEQVYRTLQRLEAEHSLDEKLAEYAFFPLTHIFNQSQRLSSRGLELAVKCVQILVSEGWRDKLAPEMAKQLLILMGLLASQNPKQQTEPATDELKVASYECMAALIRQSASKASDFLRGGNNQAIVDQLVYQLLEALTDTISDQLQVSAAHALLELQRVIKDRPMLASILPRSVSTLVKVLRPSTQVKRTKKVLVAYLQLLSELLKSVLADDEISQALSTAGSVQKPRRPGPEDQPVLDKAWLDATTPQIDLALVQVVKLKSHRSSEVTEAILDLCLMVINDCSESLARSMPLMVDTLATLCGPSGGAREISTLKHLVASRPEIMEILGAKFYEWSQSLPRIMQGSDDRPKKQLLKQITTSFTALADNSQVSNEVSSRVASVLIDSVAAAVGSATKNSKLIRGEARIPTADLITQSRMAESEFAPVILGHQSQSASTDELRGLIVSLKTQTSSQNIARNFVDRVHDLDISNQLSATWLALQFLKPGEGQAFDMMDLIEDDYSPTNLSLSRPFLVSDLYSNTLPFLTGYLDNTEEMQTDSRLVALSLEVLVLQASQLGQSYRVELMETLFPLLTLLGSNEALLQRHAVIALNLLAGACEYNSAAQMLMENVDYLINAVALRLNAFDVSKSGLQVITMMVHLCGSKLLPHLDDLIGSIFGALDNFHGYPTLVEQLFDVLKMVVTESSGSPAARAIEASGKPVADRGTKSYYSSLDNVLGDILARKERKRKSDKEHESTTAAPHRPWKSEIKSQNDNQEDPEVTDPEDDDARDQPLAPASKKEEDKISKSHQLLLNIATSTVPHMSSPSPKARLTLLELLQDICPILAPHENSFLPLINSIWPAVVQRLLDRTDAAYNVRAAAVTVGAICRAAGDFMSSRIEDIFVELKALFEQTYGKVVKSTKGHKSLAVLGGSSSTTFEADLLLPTHELSIRATPPSQSSAHDKVRTSDGQILEALIELMVAILCNVRITPDNADIVFALLGPVRHRQSVRKALLEYNGDMLWLMDHPPS